jgi:hypothetical protein
VNVTSPLLVAFARQVDWCRTSAPFTSRVLERSRLWLMQDAQAHAALSAAAPDPLACAVPLRWAAALHHLALRGLSPWVEHWPPVVASASASASASDAAIDHAITTAWSTHRLHCQAALALPPQTNEVLRSAVLLPGLLHIAARTQLPISLLEIGASAGLNLWCDHLDFDFGAWSWGQPEAELTLRTTWRGLVPVEAGAHLYIIQRAACDAAPIDLRRPDEALRLASFVWPEQAERLARLQAAIHLATRCMARDSVAVQALPAQRFVEDALQTPRAGCATVLMHSVVWQYIGAEEQAAIAAAVEAAGQRASAAAPLAWLRFEPPTPEARIALRCRLWPGGQDRLLALAHPHGEHIEWVATGAA